jgi:DNA-binding beta-propeller fold protein YncE
MIIGTPGATGISIGALQSAAVGWLPGACDFTSNHQFLCVYPDYQTNQIWSELVLPAGTIEGASNAFMPMGYRGQDVAARTAVSPALGAKGVYVSGWSAPVGMPVTSVLYQYNTDQDFTLTAMTPGSLALPTVSSGMVIDPGESNLYVVAGSVLQYGFNANNTLSALTPPSLTLTLPAGGALTGAPGPVAMSPDGSHVYVLDSYDNLIFVFLRSASGLLTPASPATISTALPPKQMVTVAGCPQTYAYVVATSATASTLYQYNVTAAGLVPMSPAFATLPSGGCQSVTVDSINNRVVVACTKENTLHSFAIGASGQLTEAAWSPVMLGMAGGVTVAPTNVAFYNVNP